MTSAASLQLPSFPSSSFLLIFLLLLFLGCTTPFEIKEVVVPKYKIRGSRAELKCLYNVGNGTLYSLKWYKGDKQFYQFIPNNKVIKNTFVVPGVKVDVEGSNAVSVVLEDVQLATSGTYRCEVLTEAPLFHTKLAEGNMTVIDLPESAPVLEGAKTRYQLGERVTVNCTSFFSKPAATLEWRINDKLVTQPRFLRRYEPRKEPDGLETAILGLTFVTNRDHFDRGEMRLKCVAKIASIYFQSQETSVIETGYMAHTQAEESRHTEHFFFFGNSGAKVSGGCLLALMVVVAGALLT